RGLIEEDSREPANNTSSCQEEELASLATDVDESIEQLNQLILDLDPTFVPVPTQCSPLSRSASLHTNGLSHKGQTNQSGWKQQKHVSNATDVVDPKSPEWRRDGPQCFTPIKSPSFVNSQHGHLYKTTSMDYCRQMDNSDFIPTTPAFPVSSPTPYVKHFSEFSQLRDGRQWDQHNWTQEQQSDRMEGEMMKECTEKHLIFSPC
ncbi:hypothetical protein CHARACLAT_008211, partial [Characodon lateralis]|nr:hypothetical protein [Characodon lateralis]